MTEVFEEAFPQYLAMGMNYTQFWQQDYTLVIAYRKAYKLKQEQENQTAWLQGAYFYDALGTALFNITRKKGEKAKSYLSKPIDFNAVPKTDEEQQRTEEIAVENEQLKAELWMRSLVNAYKPK